MPKKKKEISFEFGENDTLTSKDKTLFRKTNTWIEFRNKTIKNRGNKCELCGYNRRLTLHHRHLNDSAKSYTDLREERFRVLDQGCHRWLHRVERSYHKKKDPIVPDPRIKDILDEYIIIEKD
jgi:hypothetical protein